MHGRHGLIGSREITSSCLVIAQTQVPAGRQALHEQQALRSILPHSVRPPVGLRALQLREGVDELPPGPGPPAQLGFNALNGEILTIHKVEGHIAIAAARQAVLRTFDEVTHTLIEHAQVQTQGRIRKFGQITEFTHFHLLRGDIATCHIGGIDQHAARVITHIGVLLKGARRPESP